MPIQFHLTAVARGLAAAALNYLQQDAKEKENETEMETKSVSPFLSLKSAMGNCCSVTVGL